MKCHTIDNKIYDIDVGNTLGGGGEGSVHGIDDKLAAKILNDKTITDDLRRIKERKVKLK